MQNKTKREAKGKPKTTGKEVAHEPHASMSLMFLLDFDVFCDLLLNRHAATWNLFVIYNVREKKKRLTYLVSLDCSRICAILDIFEVVDATFRLFSFFPSLSYLHTVSQKRFSLPSLAQSRIMAKTFSELRVSRRDDARWQLL